MEIFVLALSRLVPLAFLVSLTLVGSRYLHDLLLPTRPRLARFAFAGVSLVGLLATAPFALRASLIVGATWATDKHRWKAADLLLTEYDSWNGLRSERTLRQWAFARMNGGDWRGAEQVLRLESKPSAQTWVLIGLCQYYEGNPAAESTLARVPDMTATQLCVRDYLLGRIAQRRGDFPRAYRLYAHSVRWEPNFFPSVYHGARLAILNGRADVASSILNDFVRKFSSYESDHDMHILRDSIRMGALPPDKEFVIVSN
jgi:hypothetical protein